MRTPPIVAAFATAVLASGCTWVPMAPGASAVRVISMGAAPAGCERRGEITVSVKDRLGFYERNDLRVHEELETLARNEAPGVAADTIQPLAAPDDGEQRFAAWRCGARAAANAGATTLAAAPRPTRSAAERAVGDGSQVPMSRRRPLPAEPDTWWPAQPGAARRMG